MWVTDGETGPGKEKTRKEFITVFYYLKHHDVVPPPPKRTDKRDVSVSKGRSLTAKTFEDRKGYFKG